MFSSQLNHLINSDLKLKNNFVGVFPRDKLPNLDKGSCLILNTHDSFKEGEHWLAIYVDALGNGSFFDSYGNHPNRFNLIDYLNSNCIKLEYNRVQLQGISQMCGEYCALFLYFRIRNDLRKFYSFFDSNFYFNDLKIKKLIEFYFNKNAI